MNLKKKKTPAKAKKDFFVSRVKNKGTAKGKPTHSPSKTPIQTNWAVGESQQQPNLGS